MKRTENVKITVIESEDRYSRLRLGGWQPSILKSARILAAGAGALGNEVIKNLALLGVGNIVIVDFDVIEITNLSRSVLFREADIGRYKAEVAALRAKEINPDINIEWIHGDLWNDLGTGVFRRFDMVIGCLDNRAARMAVNRHCRMASKPWIDGALDGLNGLVRIFAPLRGPCYECTMGEADYLQLRRRYSCQGLKRNTKDDPLIPTTPTAASLIAAIQVEMALRLLHDIQVPFGCELVYTSSLNEILTTRLKEKQGCLSHEIAEPIIELPGASIKNMSLKQLLTKAEEVLGPGAELDFDRELVTQLVCPGCKKLDARFTSIHRITGQELKCPICGNERMVNSIHRVNHTHTLPDTLLQELIPPGHIIRARKNETYCYLELTGDLTPLVDPLNISEPKLNKEV